MPTREVLMALKSTVAFFYLRAPSKSKSFFRFQSSFPKQSANMKAVHVTKFGGIEQMQIKESVPIPKPENNQILVRVHAAGVNPVDTYVRSGQYKNLPKLPYVPGKDGAGIVEQCNSERFKKGDRVYFRTSSGSYGQYAAVNESELFQLHKGLSFSQGAALGVAYFTAYRALVHRCRVRPGQSVLVHGASGGVGLAACQIARALGLTVIGTAGNQPGMQTVLENGAHFVFNHRDQNYMEEIMKLTNGVDVIVEMLANVNLEKDLGMMKVHGQIAIIGNRGSIEINPRSTMAVESSIHGVMMMMATEVELTETGAFLSAGQEAGWLKPVVGQEYQLEDVGKAHEQVIEHSGGTRGKIVLLIP